jgi:hypothetical protein
VQQRQKLVLALAWVLLAEASYQSGSPIQKVLSAAPLSVGPKTGVTAPESLSPEDSRADAVTQALRLAPSVGSTERRPQGGKLRDAEDFHLVQRVGGRCRERALGFC